MRGKLVFVFVVAGKIDDDLGGADSESALECGYVEDAVESACGGAVKSDANALEDDLPVIRLEGKSDAAGKSKIEERQTARAAFRQLIPAGDDRSAGRVDDEALERDLCLSGGEGEPARVKYLAGGSIEINGAAGYGEVDGAVVQSAWG